MNYSTRFWNRIAKFYSKKPVGDEQSYQKKLAETRKRLSREMNVLEFGCGTGSTALVHAPYVHHYQAIDVSPKMIEIAKNKLSATDIKNLDFKVAALEAYSVASESLDAVLGLSILHLLNNREDVIHQIYTLLKPGGMFISSTPCLGDSMAYFRFISPIGSFLGLMPKVEVFTQQELKNSLEQAGFHIEYTFVPESSKEVCFLIVLKPK
ncbi:class I SAM-dependent methyltransferase [Pseudomonadota bacterium]